MKKKREARWLGPVLCVLLLAVAGGAVKAELNARAEADSQTVLLSAGASALEPGQAAWVTMYTEDGLLSRQRGVESRGELLVQLTRGEAKTVARAESTPVSRETGEALGPARAVTLRAYAGLEPEDVYRPGKREKETFTFQLRQVPIYRDRPAATLSPEDFSWAGDRLTYAGEADFGIDVSAHQNRASRNGKIDWAAVAADGVDFCLIRAGFRGTETGALREDQFFRENLEGAMAAGLDTGVYFFSQAVTVEEALEEADFVLELLRRERITGPVAFDWERDDPAYRVSATTPEMATACAVAFCQKIAQAGFTPMVYASRQVSYFYYDQGALAPYGSWYPEYKGPDSSPLSPEFYYETDIWQFSDRCTVAGIGGPVDGNLRFHHP